MLGVIFALISYIGWGTGAFFEAITSRKLNVYSFAFWSLFISFIATSFYLPFEKNNLLLITPEIIILNCFLSLFGLGGLILYLEGLKIENRALVGMIASSFPVISVILSIIFLGERVTLFQGFAILIIFFGIILSSLNLSKTEKRRKIFSKGIIFAILTMILWGIYYAFVKILVHKIGWFMPNYISYFTFVLIFLYLKIKKQKLEKPNINNAFIPLVLSTFLVRIAEFSYNAGITKGFVAIIAPIAGANPTLFVLLAFLFFKESVKKLQIFGIVITLLGIILLSSMAI